MTHAAMVDKTAKYIEDLCHDSESAHDWWHMYRVWQLAKTIAAKEKGADLTVVELGALLHDIADWKFNDGDTTVGPRKAREWLESLNAGDAVIGQVVEIVEHISFRGGTNEHVLQTLEGQIVQDADRLDAIGAIGISRTFAFGGSRGQQIYDPALKPVSFDDFKHYLAKIPENTVINHFYEKLLLLKDKMNTATGRAMAEHRHRYMERFLKEFYAEWEGEL